MLNEVRDNTLYFDGCSTVELARQYGTPLYVFSESEIVRRAREEARIIKNDARVEANELRIKASQDAYKVLSAVEGELSQSLNTIRRRRAELGAESE